LRILHAADLHLAAKADTDYGFAVLREIVAVAAREDVDLVLLCGDIFDTFESLAQLRARFREEMAPLAGRVLMIPGNHEDLGRASQDLGAFDLGAVRLLADKPFSLHVATTRSGPVEVLAIPHQSEAFDYRGWSVPEKRTPLRLAMAHGAVQGMSYVGPDVEEGGASLDPDLFGRFGVDYAALGHIHSRRDEQRGQTLLAYSGSARVWRSGESGARTVNIVEHDGKVLRVRQAPLTTAGIYRLIEAPVNYDGSLPDKDGLPDFSGWTPHDYVELRLSGVVDDENAVKAACERFEAATAATVRRLVIKRDELTVLSGISSQPLARRFLDLWRDGAPETGTGSTERARQVWLRARELALGELKKLLEDA
jgi:DNA repair exonuclease SbcCD nuclease subunit